MRWYHSGGGTSGGTALRLLFLTEKQNTLISLNLQTNRGVGNLASSLAARYHKNPTLSTSLWLLENVLVAT